MPHFPLEELASLPNFYGPTLSYDKQKLAFFWDKGGHMELYVQDANVQGEPHAITQGELPKSLHWGFLWSKDNHHIYFVKDNDGDEQHNIWRINVETRQIEQLTDNPKSQDYPLDTTPNGGTVLVASNQDGPMNLYALDVATRTMHPLTTYSASTFSLLGSHYSPDGTQIAFTFNETADLQNFDVYVMNADGSNARLVLQMAVGSQDNFIDWSPDGRLLEVSSDFNGYQQVGIHDLATGATRWLTPAGIDYFGGKFSPDGTQFLVMRNADSAIDTSVYAVASGQEIAVELPPGLSYNADWLDNERFIVNITTDISRPEIRDYRLSNGESHVWVAADYGKIDPQYFAKHQYIWYPSTDGTPIPAIVYRPREMKDGAKYPAIVVVHGGPTGQYFRGFDTYAQFLADHGYIVIEPNVRGSTGYGKDFRDACLMDWGGKDLEDVEGAHRYLCSLPEVDTTRIGVFGGSYGGYMTFIAMTKKPHLWKAGVGWVGISDLQKLYDSSMEHFKYYFRMQMGNPEGNEDLWADRSAVNFAHQLQGKLFIVHGLNDPRCPIEQARVLRDRLLEAGKVEGQDFEYMELGEEGHGSTDIQQKIRAYKLLVDFMGRSL